MHARRRLGAIALATLLSLSSTGCMIDKLHREGRPPYSHHTTVLEDVAVAIEEALAMVGLATGLAVLTWVACSVDEDEDDLLSEP